MIRFFRSLNSTAKLRVAIGTSTGRDVKAPGSTQHKTDFRPSLPFDTVKCWSRPLWPNSVSIGNYVKKYDKSANLAALISNKMNVLRPISQKITKGTK